MTGIAEQFKKLGWKVVSMTDIAKELNLPSSYCPEGTNVVFKEHDTQGFLFLDNRPYKEGIYGFNYHHNLSMNEYFNKMYHLHGGPYPVSGTEEAYKIFNKEVKPRYYKLSGVIRGENAAQEFEECLQEFKKELEE